MNPQDTTTRHIQPSQPPHDAQQTLTPEFEPPLFPMSHSTQSLGALAVNGPELQAQSDIPPHPLSADGLTSRQEQIIVEGTEEDEKKGRRPDNRRISTPSAIRSASPSDEKFANGYSVPGEVEGVKRQSDPLRDAHRISFVNVGNETQELTVVMQEDDVVDSNGRILYSGMDSKTSPIASRRGSHLRLELKPPSPQPWDLVGPPSDNDHKGGPDNHSLLGSRKFHTLQSTTPTRQFIPRSSYYFGPPPSDSAYGTPPMGQIGVHHPREVLRIERDYTGGELIQFAPIYPLELEGRITPTQFLESVNSINELLISAHSLRHSFLDNILAVLSLQLSRIVLSSHYEKEMQRLRYLVDDLNTGLYNPVGLNILWPRNVAFLFLEIEYY